MRLCVITRVVISDNGNIRGNGIAVKRHWFGSKKKPYISARLRRIKNYCFFRDCWTWNSNFRMRSCCDAWTFFNSEFSDSNVLTVVLSWSIFVSATAIALDCCCIATTLSWTNPTKNVPTQASNPRKPRPLNSSYLDFFLRFCRSFWVR